MTQLTDRKYAMNYFIDDMQYKPIISYGDAFSLKLSTLYLSEYECLSDFVEWEEKLKASGIAYVLASYYVGPKKNPKRLYAMFANLDK